MIRFFIPGPLPGLNDVITWAGQRLNWLEKNAKKRVYKLTIEKEKWDKRVEMAALLQYQAAGGRGRPDPVKVQVDIFCLWVEPDNRRDVDNIQAGAKFVLDGLRKAGILPNDTRRWVRHVGHDISADNDPKRPGVLVTIRKHPEPYTDF